MASPLDTMQIGKLITLEQASQRLAEQDNGCTDLRWTLRFCIESFARLCIRLPYPINTWERNKEPDYGEDCGRCGDIVEERNLCMYEDASEEDMPQYCDNCQMTRRPVMGQGDYIGHRFGVLFVQGSEVTALTYPGTDEVRCRVLYDLDDSWSDGYCRLEVASEYQAMQWGLEQDGLMNRLDNPDNKQEWQELLNEQSRKDYLLLSLADLFVWKEDFESALQGGTTESRKALPMNSDSNDDTEKGKRHGQIDALCKTLIKMGYKEDESGSIKVKVGDGVLGAIQAQCFEDYGSKLFPMPKTGGNKRNETFLGIWKDAKSERYGKRVTAITV